MKKILCLVLSAALLIGVSGCGSLNNTSKGAMIGTGGGAAIGAGLGLRVTVAIATLRIDFGIPFYDPGYAPEQRWRPPHWRFNQIVTNFGINYPF